MSLARRIASTIVALPLALPVAWGQAAPRTVTRDEIRNRMIEIQRARRAALAARDEIEEGRRGVLAPRPIPTAGEDPLEVDAPEVRSTAPISARIEAINARMGCLWGEVFEAEVFGEAVGDAGAKEHLARLAEARMDGAARAHGLARAEVEKLRLAATGDASRYLDRCGAVRLRYERAGGEGRMPARSAFEVARLREEYLGGPLGEGSLFAKTLAKILADREAAGRARP